MQLHISPLHLNVVLPKYGSACCAGLDLCAYGDYVVSPHSRLVISTGICVEWTGDKSDQHYLRIAPRSGLSVKHSIDIGAGVIDYDYRGEIKVCLINHSTEPFVVKHGDRIAQAILERIQRFDTIVIVDNLTETARGSGGFGSTGI